MDIIVESEINYSNYLNLIEKGEEIKILRWRFKGREIPSLPNGLTILFCSSNQLTTLPPLPNGLTHLYCNNNQLTNLPSLPTSLTHLHCSNNQLTNLPSLPTSLTHLDCSDNQLTKLPSLPNSLIELYCENNQLLYFPYDIPKFNIQRNVNKIPTLRKVVEKFRDKVRIKREKELLFLPLPIPLIKMICEY